MITIANHISLDCFIRGNYYFPLKASQHIFLNHKKPFILMRLAGTCYPGILKIVLK